MGNKEITLTHLNIRQSISILIGKLIVIDIVGAVIVIAIYFGFVTSFTFVNFNEANSYIFLSFFCLIGILKILIVIYLVLDWMNEYYEITPEHIIHKKGIIFKKTEQYNLKTVREMVISDTLIGELLNFATITLYDIRLKKYLDLYLIHNPERYAKVIKQIRPDIEIKKDKVRLHLKDRDEEIEDLKK